VVTAEKKMVDAEREVVEKDQQLKDKDTWNARFVLLHLGAPSSAAFALAATSVGLNGLLPPPLTSLPGSDGLVSLSPSYTLPLPPPLNTPPQSSAGDLESGASDADEQTEYGFDESSEEEEVQQVVGMQVPRGVVRPRDSSDDTFVHNASRARLSPTRVLS